MVPHLNIFLWLFLWVIQQFSSFHAQEFAFASSTFGCHTWITATICDLNPVQIIFYCSCISNTRFKICILFSGTLRIRFIDLTFDNNYMFLTKWTKNNKFVILATCILKIISNFQNDRSFEIFHSAEMLTILHFITGNVHKHEPIFSHTPWIQLLLSAFSVTKIFFSVEHCCIIKISELTDSCCQNFLGWHR